MWSRTLCVAGGGNPRHLTHTANGIIQEIPSRVSVGLPDAVVAVEAGIRAITQHPALIKCFKLVATLYCLFSIIYIIRN
jgi:hypothetical protein